MLIDDSDPAARVADAGQRLAHHGDLLSGSYSDNATSSQSRRSSSPIGVPAPLCVSSPLSCALSMDGFLQLT